MPFSSSTKDLIFSRKLGAFLVRSDCGVIGLPNAFVYSTGVAFELVADTGGLFDREAQRLSRIGRRHE